MNRFLKRFSVIIIIPFLLLTALHFYVNPFKIIGKFEIEEFCNVDLSTVNLEYVSTELLLHNLPRHNYNSFIFGSSRTAALNTYRWKEFYLEDDAVPYKFAAWRETITGIHDKIVFLHKNNIPIKNAIIVIDAPGMIEGSFSKTQYPNDFLTVKYYKISDKSRFDFYQPFIYAALNPKKISQTINELFRKKEDCNILFDTITGDIDLSYRTNYKNELLQDTINRINNSYVQPEKEIVSKSVITDDLKEKLMNIKRIFDEQNTNYRIVIAPDYSQKKFNPDDLHILYKIYGQKSIFDHTGRNQITENEYNFSDIEHFTPYVGNLILENIYSLDTLKN